MPLKISTISLSLPIGLGSVNCYLIQNDRGSFLIDSGLSNQRRRLEEALFNAGSLPGDLELVVITHGDFDHTGNAIYLRGMYSAKIAMHPGDSGMLSQGDMYWNRKKGNALIRKLTPMLVRFDPTDRGQPDYWIEDGFDLSKFGLEAQVLSVPGHSLGSIAIFTASGDLFCGDLFENRKQPSFNSIMDDPEAARASLERLKKLKIHAVYPGHGKPFPGEMLSQINP